MSFHQQKLQDMPIMLKTHVNIVSDGEPIHPIQRDLESDRGSGVSQSSLCNGLQAMISMSQMNTPTNKKMTFFLSAYIPEEDTHVFCHRNYSKRPDF